MIFPFLLAALAFLTLLAIVTPLLRGHRGDAARARYDQAVYRDQLAELDRDIERGLLTADEAGAARLEIQRRLLASDRDANAAAPAPALSRPVRSPATAIVVFLVIAAGSMGTYLWIGAPGMPDMPFGSRPPDEMLAERRQQLEMQKAADQLTAKLKQNPTETRDWQLLGRTEALLGHWDKAIAAYKQAMARGATDPDTAAGYAETLVMAAGGTVTPAAEEAFQKLLAADRSSGIARYYLGLAASQAGDPKKAITLWLGLLADMPSDSPLRAQIGSRIEEAARSAGIPAPPLPPGTESSKATAAAGQADSMTDEQRQTMIEGMVARLAAKQQADPNNLAGWMQLGKAYAVLHETDKAVDAYDKAMALKPDDASIGVQAVQELTRAQDPQQPLPPRLVALLRNVQMTAPKEPVVLWFLGIAALQARHPDEAKRYWTDLLGVLPPASADAHTVQAALDMLAKAKSGTGG